MQFEEIDILGDPMHLRHSIEPSFVELMDDFVYELVSDLHTIQVSTRDLLTDRLRTGNLARRALADVNYATAQALASLIQPIIASKAILSQEAGNTVQYSQNVEAYIDLVQALVQVFNNHGGLIEVSQFQSMIMSAIDSNAPGAVDAAVGMASLLAQMPNKTFNLGDFLLRYLGLARAIRNSEPLFEWSYRYINDPGYALPYEAYLSFLQGVSTTSMGANRQNNYVRAQVNSKPDLAKCSVFDPTVLNMLFASTTSEGSVSLLQACLTMMTISSDFAASPLASYINNRISISSIKDDEMFKMWFPSYAWSKGIVIERKRLTADAKPMLDFRHAFLSIELLDQKFTDTDGGPFYTNSGVPGDDFCVRLTGDLTMATVRASASYKWVSDIYKILYQIHFIKAVCASNLLNDQSRIRNPLFSVVDVSKCLDPDAPAVFAGIDVMFNLRRSLHSTTINTLRKLLMMCVPNVEVVDGKYIVNDSRRRVEQYHTYLQRCRTGVSFAVNGEDHVFKAADDHFNIFKPVDLTITDMAYSLIGNEPVYAGQEFYESAAGRMLKEFSEAYYKADLRKPTDTSFALEPYHLRYYDFVDHQISQVTLPPEWVGNVTTDTFSAHGRKFKLGTRFVDQIYGLNLDPDGELLLITVSEMATLLETILEKGIVINKYERIQYLLVGGSELLKKAISRMMHIDMSLIHHIMAQDYIAGMSGISFIPRSQFNTSQSDVDRYMAHTLAGNFLPFDKALALCGNRVWLLDALSTGRISLHAHMTHEGDSLSTKEYKRRMRIRTMFAGLGLPEPLTIDEFELMYDIHHLFLPVVGLRSIDDLDTLPNVLEYRQLNQIDPMFNHDVVKGHRKTRLTQIKVIGADADALRSLEELKSYIFNGAENARSRTFGEMRASMGQSITDLLTRVGLFAFYKVTTDRREMPTVERLPIVVPVIRGIKVKADSRPEPKLDESPQRTEESTPDEI